jgi:predicted RNase H-like HicB family nuclease
MLFLAIPLKSLNEPHMTINNLKYAVWKEGKQYVSQCLNVEVASCGKTRKEAIKNLEEALDLYFEDIKKPKIIKITQIQIVSGALTHA